MHTEEMTPVTLSFSRLGALLAFLAVAGGAFGAHSLKAVLSSELLTVFETAVRYQMYHALALLVIGQSMDRGANTWFHWAGWCFLLGVVLFSGSLYALVFSGTRWLGAITPLGGVAFLIGWGLVAWGSGKRVRG
jgi:uncharacterized membrane protein YgdD (TMEM256/DUF423 family)